MIERIKRVQNPLTIIAIFAAIAEISGTTVLPFIAAENQGIYIWFLMLFPLILILLFFLTLNFNHKVLYAPSDFRDEDNFLKLFNKSNMFARVTKLKEEIADSENGETQENTTTPEKDATQENSYRDIIKRNTKATYLLAEELTINKLSQEFGSKIEREMMLNASSAKFMFDGLVSKGNRIFAVEIKYFKETIKANMIRKTLKMISRVYEKLDEDSKKAFHLVLAITTDAKKESIESSKFEVSDIISNFPFPVSTRFYSLHDLEKEFGLS